MKKAMIIAVVLLGAHALSAGANFVECGLRECGIQPGAVLLYPRLSVPWVGVTTDFPVEGMRSVGCSMGFLVTDAPAASQPTPLYEPGVYVSIAGHCFGSVGKRARTSDPVGEFGTVVYRWCGENNVCDLNADFALIKVDVDKIRFADPTVIGWAAPERIFTDAKQGDHVVRHSGWGWGVGSVTPYSVERDGVVIRQANSASQARQGMMMQADEDLFWEADPLIAAASGGQVGGMPPGSSGTFAVFRSVASPADSGSAVLALDDPLAPPTQGGGTQALGVITQILPHGTVSVTRLDVGLARAEEVLGRTFRLWRGQDDPALQP